MGQFVARDTQKMLDLQAIVQQLGVKATAEAMRLPYRKAKRWFEVWRETGAVAERKFGYRSKLDEHEDFLRELVAKRPTIKLAEVHEVLSDLGVNASKTTVWNALTRFGIALAERDARHAADVKTIVSSS